MSETLLSRRDALKLTAGALMAVKTQATRTARKVIVAGAGIGGLSCAWELMRRGHEVVVLEAAERTGGHVFTFRDPLDDGLYADAGAEHFTQPGYERYWSYVNEFKLPHRYYPRRDNILRFIGGKTYTPEMLADQKVLAGFGLNRRELDYLKTHPFPELAGLYYAPYMDAFRDEYRPFDAGLNHLDQISTADLFRKDGASAGALEFIGGGGSALYSVWHAAILKLRGVPLFPPRVYRLVGGNQKLPDAFVERLGSRIRLRSPVTRIEHGQTGVRVTCASDGSSTTHEADYLVCAMSAVRLRAIPVEPAWPADKAWALQNVPYYFDSRVIFQSRTQFWKRDGITPEHGVRGSGVEPRVDDLRRGGDLARVARRHGHRRGITRGGAGGVSQALSGQVGRHREGACRRLGEQSLGLGVRNHVVPPGPARQVLADAHRAARAHPLRRRLRRQPELGHGSRDAIGLPRVGGDRQVVNGV